MSTKAFAPEKIRNIALVGHGSSGKTSLAEAMMFVSGATNRLGKVDDHTSLLDFEPEEHKRLGSIATSLAWIEHDGHKINLLDTPGDQNFIFDAFLAMHGADAVVITVSAPDGVEVQTERVFHKAKELGLPCVFVVNKMDRDRADHDRCLEEIEKTFGVKPVPLQIPIGREHDFKGVVSLFQQKALIYATDGSGKYEATDVPAELADEMAAAREALVENVAETDEELLEKYLETFELTEEELHGGFHAALKRGEIAPVLFTAATACIGAHPLLDLTTWALPSPVEGAPITADTAKGEITLEPKAGSPFAAQIVHTTVDEFSGKMSIFRIFAGEVPSDNLVHNPNRGEAERLGALFSLRGKEREVIEGGHVVGDIVGVAKLKHSHSGDTLVAPGHDITLHREEYPEPMMSYVIRPQSKTDADKIKVGLERILEEDPTLSVSTEALTQQLVLSGMGQAHLDMAIERMKRKYKVNVEYELPPVPYRETIRKAAMHVEGKHKKQTGGAGQFGVAFINVVPQPRDAGFVFEDKIVGGAIPRQFIPSVEKGLHTRMSNGFLAGYPIVDIKVELVDGKYHPVDSKDVAFQMAGSKGLKAAFEQGGTVLLEPIMVMEIVVPTEVMGDVMGDMTSRRGQVRGMEPKGKNTVIKAVCPLAEVQRYAPDLRGMSGGKGSFTMSLHGYEEVPRNLVDGIVSASPFRRDAHDED